MTVWTQPGVAGTSPVRAVKGQTLIFRGGRAWLAVVLLLALVPVGALARPVIAQELGGQSPPAIPPSLLSPLPPQTSPSSAASPLNPSVTDLDPTVGANDKVGIVVRHQDGSYEEYLVARARVGHVIGTLGSTDKLWSIIPPASALGPFHP
jgi:hypothetical protein